MMAASQSKIAQLIRARREQMRLSQQDVSNGLEMSRGSYSRLESGQTTVSAEDLTKIAAILQIRACYLLGEDPEDESATRRDDVVRLYEDIEPDMQPAALAMIQGLHDKFPSGEEDNEAAGETRH
ncbi:MAG: helix-turn-helix transcriptional regulator [Capsulimonas sp.]|uniref:helix-turn-helix domain-containing protein n=1 Tax=Capsulimonas sp. TaxID=2494211 RepID=UPI003265FC9A